MCSIPLDWKSYVAALNHIVLSGNSLPIAKVEKKLRRKTRVDLIGMRQQFELPLIPHRPCRIYFLFSAIPTLYSSKDLCRILRRRK